MWRGVFVCFCISLLVYRNRRADSSSIYINLYIFSFGKETEIETMRSGGGAWGGAPRLTARNSGVTQESKPKKKKKKKKNTFSFSSTAWLPPDAD